MHTISFPQAMHRQCYEYAKQGLRYGGLLRQYRARWCCWLVQEFLIYLSQRGYSPFVYRDGTGWPASLPYIRKIHVSVAIGTQSGILLHKTVPMDKIWGSSKNDQNRITGKLLKFIFTILHLLVVVVVVVLLLQFQLTYLKNRTELRNETLHTDRTP